MKKLIGYILGILLLALVVVMLFFASAIYDTRARESIQTYFFQRDGVSVRRPGEPVRESDIGETAMREILIKKYVTEYFYAIPDVENIAVRTQTQSTLARMSTADVFNTWVNGQADIIQSMAQRKMMRTVAIDGEIHKPADSDYWIVPYVLYTWETPNDITTKPKATHGTLLMGVRYEPGFRSTIDVGKILKHNYNNFESQEDPATVFKFMVEYLENRTND
jgi:hypothetical protein